MRSGARWQQVGGLVRGRCIISSGSVVGYLGDGINDAAALAQADVGLAIGSGTDIALEAGDVVLLTPDLRGVVNAVRLARRTLRTIYLNFFWAYAYNVVLIPVAAAAMSLSSLFVLTNSLRLRAFRPQALPSLNPAASS